MAIIALDFDGVYTAPFQQKSIALSRLGYDIKPEETEKHLAFEIMRMQNPSGNHGEDWKKAISTLYTRDILTIPLAEDVARYHNLILRNHEIIIVTSRFNTPERPEAQAALDYLAYHGLEISDLVSTNEGSKKDILDKINPLFYVDDSVWKMEGLTCETYLFRNLANAHMKYPNVINNWRELYELITEKEL